MNRKTINLIVILAIIVVIIFISLGFMGFTGFNFGQQPAQTQPANDGNAQALLEEIQKTGSVTELQFVDLVEGAGSAIAPGDIIEVKYTGVLPNGTVFDATDAHGGIPLKLIVAPDGSLMTETGGGLIQGWSLGMRGMKEGGRRLLAIPPQLGYGGNSIGAIPPNSTLLFEVEIVKKSSGGAPATAE
ncbi:FKBP-type peptidyl-prolyl cis-trans isomerase [Patescibacteria group bacterium]|nr:FKBP-type peptidyl-prolyl cis-trans isomerase [Patescibacteria group bacterium]